MPVLVNLYQSSPILLDLMVDTQGKGATVAIGRKAGSYKARTLTSHFPIQFNIDQL